MTPGVRAVRVVVAEIGARVIDWNRRFFAEVNGGAVDDPRVEVVIDDLARVVDDGNPTAALGGQLPHGIHDPRVQVVALGAQDPGGDHLVQGAEEGLGGQLPRQPGADHALGLPLLTGADGKGVPQLGANVFRYVHSPVQRARALARYLGRVRKGARVAVLGVLEVQMDLMAILEVVPVVVVVLQEIVLAVLKLVELVPLDNDKPTVVALREIAEGCMDKGFYQSGPLPRIPEYSRRKQYDRELELLHLICVFEKLF